MTLLWGALAGVVAMHVYDAVRAWWHARHDHLVDRSFVDVQEALRVYCDTIEVPPFRVVTPLYDWEQDGAA